MQSTVLREEPAFQPRPVRLNRDGVSAAAFSEPFAPRQIKTLCFEGCRLDVDSGVALTSDGAYVDVSLYLRRHIPAERQPIQPGDAPPAYDGKAVVAYNFGWRNYYHWLIQCAFSAWLARGLDGDFIFPTLGEVRLDVLRRAGFPVSRIRAFAPQSKLSAPHLTYIGSCYHSQAVAPSAIMPEFAARIARTVDATSPTKRFYISRRDSPNRAIANEAELESELASRGYEVVTLTGKSFAEQIALFRSAEAIVAPHGAGLSNIIFCRPGTRIVELTPAHDINPCFVRLGQVFGLDYELHAVPAEKPAGASRHAATWRVEPGRVAMAL